MIRRLFRHSPTFKRGQSHALFQKLCKTQDGTRAAAGPSGGLAVASSTWGDSGLVASSPGFGHPAFDLGISCARLESRGRGSSDNTMTSPHPAARMTWPCSPFLHELPVLGRAEASRTCSRASLSILNPVGKDGVQSSSG